MGKPLTFCISGLLIVDRLLAAPSQLFGCRGPLMLEFLLLDLPLCLLYYGPFHPWLAVAGGRLSACGTGVRSPILKELHRMVELQLDFVACTYIWKRQQCITSLWKQTLNFSWGESVTPLQCFQMQCAMSTHRSYHLEWNITDHVLVSPSKDADRFSWSHRRGFMTVETHGPQPCRFG